MISRLIPIVSVIIFLVLSFSPCVFSRKSFSGLYCALCEIVVDEIGSGIARTEIKHSVQTRWRVDEKKRIPYERTEHRLIEIIEQEIPKSLERYGLRNNSDPVKLVKEEDIEASNVNNADATNISETVITNNADSNNIIRNLSLSLSVRSLYDKLVDLHLEDLLLTFHTDHRSDSRQLKEILCIKKIKACKKGTKFEINPNEANKNNNDNKREL